MFSLAWNPADLKTPSALSLLHDALLAFAMTPVGNTCCSVKPMALHDQTL